MLQIEMTPRFTPSALEAIDYSVSGRAQSLDSHVDLALTIFLVATQIEA